MSDLSDRIVAQFRRDWRRTGVLAVLTIVAIVLMVRQFAGSGANAQANGSAANKAPAPVRKAAKTTAPVVAKTTAAPAPVNPADRNKVFEFEPQLGDRMAILQRDPFKADLSLYAVDPDSVPKGKAAAQVTTGPEGNDDESRRRNAEAAVRDEASKLRLQLILMANPARAVIGGDSYTVGQRVGSFTLTRINKQNVTLEKDGFEVMLSLQ